jgi:hypothetical protein
VKITHLKGHDEKLEFEFYNFFLSSKPYDLDHIRSSAFEEAKNRDFIRQRTVKTCEVYTVEENSKLKAAAFLLGRSGIT